MGQSTITEIAAGLQDWDLLAKLPRELNGFRLQPSSDIKGQILNIAAYVNEERHSRLDLTYTAETFDYVPVKTVGLHVFREEKLFFRDRDKFASELLAQLPELLSKINMAQAHQMNYEASAIGFDKWDYWRSLPRQIGSFELFITPDNPLEYLNGSYIFLDYTDFKHNNQIYFAYNIYRNELFAELKQNGIPITTSVFDVPNVVKDNRKLDMLAGLIDAHLQNVMHDLEKS